MGAQIVINKPSACGKSVSFLTAGTDVAQGRFEIHVFGWEAPGTLSPLKNGLELVFVEKVFAQ